VQKKAASDMPGDTFQALADRLGIKREQAEAASRLLDDRLNPTFIAHYRKSATGGLDEPRLRRLATAREDLRTLEDLRERVRREAKRTGLLTDEWTRALDEATEAELLRDLLELTKPGRRTAATVAAERGLAPLADYAWAGPAEGPDLARKAAEFVSHPREVRSAEDALAGAGHILAERFSRDWRVRQAVRRCVWEKGILQARQAKHGGKASAEFRAYFKFDEPVAHLPPHRVLAINRGERSKAIKVSFALAPETLLEEVMPIVLRPGHRFAEFLKTVLGDALGRLVLPTIEREVRRRLTRQAEEHAIEVFAANLESLLMTPPLANTRILVIQPGFRSGCKVAVLDVDGTLLAETIIYPHEPKKQWLEGKTALLAAIRSHNVQAVAIGNGTGCRATEEFVSEVIEENHLDLQYTIVNEAGAGAYADSPLAKEEFPNLEASLRATIGIGRRLQNPLAELVKIDLRAVGVGLYQHDVNQDHLKATLEQTVQSCVAAVGADANTASPALLRYVPGLGPQAIEALAARRRAGPITSREELRALPAWDDPGAPGFLQAAGFLRVTGLNPLDATPIHPESYPAAERLLARVGHTAQDLTIADSAKALEKDLTGISLEPLASDVGVPMLELVDLVGALQHPGLDPRSKHAPPIFRKKIRHIEDLQPGMWVKGTVRNVVDFGAFVDVGLAEDGLVHISQFSPHYIRNPMKFLHAGDVVEVRVVSIDADRSRIALTLIPEPRPVRPKPAPRRPAKKAAAAAGAASAEAPAAPAKAAPARGARPRGGRTPPPKTLPGERRVAAGEHRPSRRPPQGPREGAPGKPGGARSARTERTGPPGRSRKDRPSPRSGEPRIHVFRDEPAESPAETDDEGRPKIRWAHYESDLREAETPDEIETFEETEAVDETPAVEQTEPPGSAKEPHDTV
jgi:uncharacterized protein